MDIDSLYECAKEATPGPWSALEGAGGWGISHHGIIPISRDDRDWEILSEEDSWFISRANPKAIMELIDALRVARENEVQCSGMCLTGSDVGVYGNGIAYPHDSCPKHGDPYAFGIKGDLLLDKYREKITALEYEVEALRKELGKK